MIRIPALEGSVNVFADSKRPMAARTYILQPIPVTLLPQQNNSVKREECLI